MAARVILTVVCALAVVGYALGIVWAWRGRGDFMVFGQVVGPYNGSVALFGLALVNVVVATAHWRKAATPQSLTISPWITAAALAGINFLIIGTFASVRV